MSVCGEMAGDVAFTRLLLGLGLRSFSMHPVADPGGQAGGAARRHQQARALGARGARVRQPGCDAGALNRRILEARWCVVKAAECGLPNAEVAKDSQKSQKEYQKIFLGFPCLLLRLLRILCVLCDRCPLPISDLRHGHRVAIKRNTAIPPRKDCRRVRTHHRASSFHTRGSLMKHWIKRSLFGLFGGALVVGSIAGCAAHRHGWSEGRFGRIPREDGRARQQQARTRRRAEAEAHRAGREAAGAARGDARRRRPARAVQGAVRR